MRGEGSGVDEITKETEVEKKEKREMGLVKNLHCTEANSSQRRQRIELNGRS